jgi:hypothetical protein
MSNQPAIFEGHTIRRFRFFTRVFHVFRGSKIFKPRNTRKKIWLASTQDLYPRPSPFIAG